MCKAAANVEKCLDALGDENAHKPGVAFALSAKKMQAGIPSQIYALPQAMLLKSTLLKAKAYMYVYICVDIYTCTQNLRYIHKCMYLPSTGGL